MPFDMMMISAKTKQTGWLLTGALFGVFLFTTPAQAQYSDTARLMDRINQLENQVQTLSRTVYRGETPAGNNRNTSSAATVDSSALGIYQDRVNQLEQSLRSLTNQVEQQTYEIHQMKERLDKALADIEMRLSDGAANVSSPPMVTSPRTLTPPSSNPTVQPLGSLGNQAGASAERDYEDAFALVREAKYAEAESRFKTFIDKYPDHRLTPNAQYWLAETYYVRGDYHQAARTFATGYQNYPNAPKAADCLLKLSLSLAKLGKTEDACLSLEQLKKEFAGDTTPVMRRAVQESRQLGCN